MKKKLLSKFYNSIFFKKDNIVSKLPVNIFSEGFGYHNNPAILLNAGAGCQGISWPDEFCIQLAKNGFYVIRYDYRGTGLTELNCRKAAYFNALDLAKDTSTILEKHRKSKAIYVGFSMGGQVSIVTSAHLPNQVKSMVLISTSPDFRQAFASFIGKRIKNNLSQPDKAYVSWARLQILKSAVLEDNIDNYLENCYLLSGKPRDFDWHFCQDQINEASLRKKQGSFISHVKSMRASHNLHMEAVQKIQTPTLIIHGQKDPIFPIDHAIDLHKKIAQSRLINWPDFGHFIYPKYYQRIIESISDFAFSEQKIIKKSADTLQNIDL